MWRDFTYQGEGSARGVIEVGMADSVLEAIRDGAPLVARSLKVGDRDMLGDCGYSTSSWARVLAQAGIVVRTVGGRGQHVETVPPTAAEHQGGYRTTDDGLVEHWWLMLEEDGRIFDPTAHQFDERGGVRLDRYQVDGSDLAIWRLDWPTCAAAFMRNDQPIPDAASRWRERFGGRSG